MRRRRLLPCLLLVLTLAAGCQRPVPKAVFVDPALTTLIPSDTYSLVGAKLETLPNLPVYKKYLGRQQFALLDSFQQQTGIDPRKDLYELLTARSDRGTTTFIKGKFSDIVGHQPNLQFGGQQPTMYKGLMLLGSEQSGVVFLNSSVAALGTQPMLRSLIDERDRGPAPIVNTLIKKAEGIPHDVQLWSISLRGGNPFPIPIPQTGNLANLNNVFNKIQEFQAWADLRTGVNVTMHLTAPSEAEARRLGDTLRGLLGLLRISTNSSKTALLKMYDNVQVTQQQSVVDLKTNIPEDLLEAALGDNPMSAFTR